MQVQAQVSLALGAAMLFVFLSLSSERYGLLLAGFASLAVAFVLRAAWEGEFRWTKLREHFLQRQPGEVIVGPSADNSLDHVMHRVFPP